MGIWVGLDYPSIGESTIGLPVPDIPLAGDRSKHEAHGPRSQSSAGHLLAESDRVGFEPGRGPEQVHFALTGKVGQMRVMFVTNDGMENFVTYGLTRENMDRVVSTRIERYEKEDLCDTPY